MFIISKGTKNAKIIKKYLVGGVVAFYTGHECQLKCKTQKSWILMMFLPFFPRMQLDSIQILEISSHNGVDQVWG